MQLFKMNMIVYECGFHIDTLSFLLTCFIEFKCIVVFLNETKCMLNISGIKLSIAPNLYFD